jgi:hypothetical protein
MRKLQGYRKWYDWFDRGFPVGFKDRIEKNQTCQNHEATYHPIEQPPTPAPAGRLPLLVIPVHLESGTVIRHF